MHICSSCLLSLKGILHQSPKSPSLLPLPPPPLGPGGLGSPWVDPSQGSCLAPAIPWPCTSTPSSQRGTVILSRRCCCFLVAGALPRQVQTALLGLPPLNTSPALQLTSVSAVSPLNANITWHTLLHLCPEPQVPTVYCRAASSRKSSYQSLPPQTPPALNHLRLDNLLLSSVLFFSPLFWWEGPKWYHRTALNANPGSLSCR